jgi:hypothetical protein
VVNNGALGALNTGVVLDGRSFTTTGALTTTAITVTIPSGCNATGIATIDAGNENGVATIYPNPFMSSLNILLNETSQISNGEFRLYNILGEAVMNSTLTQQATNLKTSGLPSGIYIYNVISNNKIIQSGKLVSQQ